MQQTIIHIALSNAAVATLLAVAALAVTVAFRRPALSHAAWILVLLKLLTPPLFTVPIDVPRPAETSTAPAVAAVAPQTEDVQAGLLPDEPLTYPSIEESVAVAEVAPLPRAALQVESIWTRWSDHWPTPLIVTWGTGSILVLALILVRLLQFRRILQYAAPATDDVQDQVLHLCADLDIRPVPSVCFVPGGVCPMLIGLGRTSRILVPRDLWGRLDEHQRGTLLVHELAHLRRGDQWVRVVELLVTVLYWWHPVAWFARRELREAEEQCCDAWVVWAMPRSARDYAVALMEAIDTTTRSRPMVRPVLGSGMGEFHHLRRRLIMIKQGKVARALTWSGFGAMCGVGALLLPLSPTLAFEDKGADLAPAADPFSVVERLDGIDGVAVAVEAPPVAPTPGADNFEYADDPAAAQFKLQVEAQQAKAAEQAQRAEQQALNAELQATHQVIQQLSRELERAHQRLAQLEARRHGGDARAARPGAGAAPGFRGVMPRRIEPRVTPPHALPPAATPAPMKPGKPLFPDVGPGKEGPRVEGMPKNPTATIRRGPAAGEGGQEKRLDALEDRLADLLEEVRSLKKQRNDDGRREGKSSNVAPPPTAPPAGEPAPL